MMNEILFGMNYPENDKNWQKIQQLREAGIKEIQVATPVNFLPWLRHLVPKFRNTLDWMIQGKLETHAEYKKVVDLYGQNNEDCISGMFCKKRRELLAAESPDVEFFRYAKNLAFFEVKCLLSCQSDEQLYHLVADLFGAGLDTTLTTLKWAILYLSSFPETQEIIREELEGKTISFRSQSEMPKTMVMISNVFE